MILYSHNILKKEHGQRYFVFCDTAQCPALAWNVLQNGGGVSGKWQVHRSHWLAPPYGPTNHVHAQAHAAANNDEELPHAFI